jgi:hypothetical protein
MLSRLIDSFSLGDPPKLTGEPVRDVEILAKNLQDTKTGILAFLRSLNQPNALDITQAAQVETTGDVVGANFGSGKYTPTLTNGTNCAASTPHVWQWLRADDSVTVSGIIGIDPTAAATATELSATLPLNPLFGTGDELGGAGSDIVGVGDVLGIYAGASGLAEFILVPTGAGSVNYSFSFTYHLT